MHVQLEVIALWTSLSLVLAVGTDSSARRHGNCRQLVAGSVGGCRSAPGARAQEGSLRVLSLCSSYGTSPK